ncbi:MAG: hypothetical protein GQ470_01335 [Gammaproteobacteria bacterium]|nr:hypothetical protein [Gammaproteobacteria bacterium]
MKYRHVIIGLVFSLLFSSKAFSEADSRVMVELPDMMKSHTLQNMRGHLVAIDQLLMLLAEDKMDDASDLAEAELGMSSLTKHGANHVGAFYPEGMRQAGTAMHRAASQFSRVAQEGDVLAAYKALRNITAACNVCHAGYRLQ